MRDCFLTLLLYIGISIRLKQVCARGNTLTFLSPYIVNLRMLPSLPCRGVDNTEACVSENRLRLTSQGYTIVSANLTDTQQRSDKMVQKDVKE